MQSLKLIQNLLLALFVVYYAQGSLYPQGSSLSQGALAIILGISIFFFFKTLFLKRNKNAFYKAWTALLLLNIIGFIFTGSLDNPLHFSMLKAILITLLPFYPFYYYAGKKTLTTGHLLIFFLVMLPVTMLQYYYNSHRILMEASSDNLNQVNNIAYSFVALIPFAFLFRRQKVLSVVSMMILIFFIIDGAKRGALVVGVIGLLYFIYFQLRTVEKRHKIKAYLFIFIATVGMVFYTYQVYESNTFLISRIQAIGQEGGSSGRNIIYENILSAWYNSDNFLHFLFGYGFAASLKMSGTGNYAHNDWLELLSNFGLLGVIIYGMLFYAAFKFIKSRQCDPDNRIIMLAIVSMWFTMTLFSMFYPSGTAYTQVILMAFFIGQHSGKRLRADLEMNMLPRR